MKIVTFFIPGPPGVKQRPKFNRVTGSAYTPEQTLNYENYIKYLYSSLSIQTYWDNEPMELSIKAVFDIPKSYTKKRKLAALAGEIAPSLKDCDNIAKVIADALNGIAYQDDRHICRLQVEKIYSDKEKTGVHVIIRDYKKYITSD